MWHAINLKGMKDFFFFKNNMQLHQTLWLMVLLFCWVNIYGLDISALEIFVVFSSVIIIDTLLIKYETWKFSFPFSWVNVWFWMSFFLSTDDLMMYVFAAILGMMLKSLFSVWSKSNYLYKSVTKWSHFLNPSNSAVFLTLVLFPLVTWTNPLQWWQSVWYPLYFLAMFLMFVFWMNMEWSLKNIFKVHYFDVIFTVLISHMILFFLLTKETLESALLFFNWAFFMFMFFQITDPKTMPEKQISSILYWMAISLLFYVLWYFMNENYAMLWSLFFMTLFLPIIWKLENEKFNKKFNKADMFLFILMFLFMLSIFTLINYYWIPDLVFNNSCNQLICS